MTSVPMPGSDARPLPAADLEHVLQRTSGIWDDFKGSRFLVTGGTGFFGRWMLESFLRANDEFCLGAGVTVLTRDVRRAAASAPHVHEHAAVTMLAGDLRSLSPLDVECTDVLHMAAETTYPPGGVSPGEAFTSAVVGTMRVLDLARACRVRRLLLTSSGAVYGQQPPGCRRIGEESRLAPPTNDSGSGYAQGKRAAEYLCANAAGEWGLQAKLARCFAFVGPLLALDANYAIGNFIRDALARPAITVQSDGTARRSYLYAGDLAVWLWHILARGHSGRPYNVGSSSAVSVGDLAQTVAATLCPDKPVHVALPAPAGVLPPRYVPDTQRAEKELGLEVSVMLEDGIERTAKWHGWRPPTSAGHSQRPTG
jgi:dTDP-glucose 4,6-dehydratase